MGYGKTIQALGKEQAFEDSVRVNVDSCALANIVDGRCLDPDDPVKTTLVVVPPHLVVHWYDLLMLLFHGRYADNINRKNQVLKHCETDAVGEVLIYSAQYRLCTLDIDRSLQQYSVM